MARSAEDADALRQLARQHLHAGDPAAAGAVAHDAAERFPDDPSFHDILADCGLASGDDGLVEQALLRLLALQPRNLGVLNRLGIFYDRQKRHREALVVLEAALALAPEEPSVLTNLGLLHEHKQEYGLAESLQRRAWALAPDSAGIGSNLAALLARLERFGEAETLYMEALRVQPEFVQAHINLGVLYTDQGRLAEAETAFRRAIAIDPENSAAHAGLAPVLLMQGRFAEGWRCHEARQTLALFRQWFAADPARQNCRYWQGEALTGKSVLVFPEQGFGDEIQFARYLVLLRQRGAARITQICYPEQEGLMRSLQGPDQVLSLAAAAQHQETYDYWTLLMSLPCYMNTTLGSVPARTPYLEAEPGRVASWSRRLQASAGTFRVGLVWRGSVSHSNDADRSLPGPGGLASLWSVPGVSILDLTRCAPDQAGAGLPEGLSVCFLGDQLADFSDLAGVLTQLDLLISVDTAAAHLAGALGLPCGVLLPAYRPDWRWLQGRADSPWYPEMRLFRQQQRGDWRAPIAQALDFMLECMHEKRRHSNREVAPRA